ncbi:MAG: SLC13 family permease [Alphaproteobacteria bacterium]|nr:SLC13 family permease [Alphaproteobacteria bacterium]
MISDQNFLFILLFFVFVLLIWGRWRYDLVAFAALCVALIYGVVPKEAAFSGFGHKATVIIALVLIVSRALSNSGAIELLARYVVDASRSLALHISIMSALAAGLSAIMNNVAALALLMPIDLQTASKAKRSPALTLMPISFASILGGMITLIGTPPNIVIAEFRETAFGEPFAMFDFAPVGLVCALVGVTFIAVIGWRLIPAARSEHDTGKELFDLKDYIAELSVPEGSKAIGKAVRELDEIADDSEASIIGLIRGGKRLPGMSRRVVIEEGDLLVVEAAPSALDKLAGALKLEITSSDMAKAVLDGADDITMIEVVVPEGSRIEGRSALTLGLLYRHGVSLLGVSRQGRRFTERVRRLQIEAGDVLLLLGPSERLGEIASWLGALPLAERGLQVIQREKAWLAVGIFASAVLLASLGHLDLAVALAAAVVLMALFNIVPLRQIYESIEWPVIVLLGSMIPIGAALEQSGGTALIAGSIVQLAEGYAPWVVLTLLVVVTMTLSDVMNNTATAVIAAPIAVDIANRLNVNPDPFLMGVAVAASCAFLTPIGHKNNTLIMGPGGYRFGDYWRMGLPLEVLIIAVAVPTILLVWPL